MLCCRESHSVIMAYKKIGKYPGGILPKDNHHENCFVAKIKSYFPFLVLNTGVAILDLTFVN